jgi:hypothetical protein
VSIPGQAFSIGAVLGTFLGVLPPILALLAALIATAFYAVSLWESRTVQSWWKGREFVRLRAEQAKAARILLRAQAAAAFAKQHADALDAAALKAAQAVTADALNDAQKKA